MDLQLQDILHKEMSRKEFLALVGLGLCSVFGIGSVIRLLGGKSLAKHTGTFGYSSGEYAGRRSTSRTRQ